MRDRKYEYRSRQLDLMLRKKPCRNGLTVAFHARKAGRGILTGEDIDRAYRAAEERARSAEKRLAAMASQTSSRRGRE